MRFEFETTDDDAGRTFSPLMWAAFLPALEQILDRWEADAQAQAAG